MSLIRFDAPYTTWSPLPPTPLASIASGEPVEYGIELFAEDGLSVGLWSCTPWASVLAPYPVDEVMVVLDGTVRIRFENGRTETFGAGDCFYLPKGLPCAWEQDVPVRKIYVIFENGLPITGAGQGGGLRFDPLAQLAPAEGPPAHVLKGPAPHQRSVGIYADGAQRFTLGQWSSTPYSRRTVPHPRHELMHLFNGEVTLNVPGEAPCTIGAGQTVFVPQGVPVAWDSAVPVTKLFCMIEAAP